MRAAADARAAPHRGRFAALAAAAGLGAAALLVLWQPWTDQVRPVTAADTSAGAAAALDDYLALVERSAELERALVSLPAQRNVMRAGTAGTIATLEDRIARIDAELTLAAAAGAKNEYRTALWRDRVDVMNALVQVRYVNSQAFVF
jgi:hypothetical protein